MSLQLYCIISQKAEFFSKKYSFKNKRPLIVKEGSYIITPVANFTLA
jgi:hypothetical protein